MAMSGRIDRGKNLREDLKEMMNSVPDLLPKKPKDEDDFEKRLGR